MLLNLIASRQQGISISYLGPPQSYTAAFVRQVVLINGTAANETFGYYYGGDNYTIPQVAVNVSYPPVPFTGWPSGYMNNCSICYNESTPTQPSSRV